MTDNDQLDSLADKINSNVESPGTLFRQEKLDDLPVSQWPAYIDDTALDVVQNRLGRADITPDNFGSELGNYYRQGLLALSGSNPDLRGALDKISNEELGELVLGLRKKIDEVRREYANPNRVIEGFVNKLLSSHTNDFDPVSVPSPAMPSDILIELLTDSVISQSAGYIPEKLVSESVDDYVEKPILMLPLREEDRERLSDWGQKGSGYVIEEGNQKTVGLGAIAHHYGGFHPTDSDLVSSVSPRTTPNILVVDESENHLERWRASFERVFGIPSELLDVTTFRPNRFDWGHVYFRTADEMEDTKSLKYDLILLGNLDEYARSEWLDLLEESDSDFIGLASEPVTGYDEISSETPDFDWEVRFAELEDEDLIALSKQTKRGFEEYVEPGDFDSFQDVLSHSKTTEGIELKRDDDGFRRFVTALVSRRAKARKAVPSVDAGVRVVTHAVTRDQKTLVLVDKSVVDEFDENLRSVLGKDAVEVFDFSESEFSDFNDDHDVVLVPLRILFEDVELPRADVVVNAATRFSQRGDKSLIRRLKRELGNSVSEDQGSISYCHLLGLPSTTIPVYDGATLLENVSSHLTLGQQFGDEPGYASSSEEVEKLVSRLEVEGAKSVIGWSSGEESAFSAFSDEYDTLMLADRIHSEGSPILFDEWETSSESPTPSLEELDTDEDDLGLPEDLTKDDVDAEADDFIPLLDSEDEMTRVNACHALSQIAEESPEEVEPAEDRLVELLWDPNQDVRNYSCRALGFVGSHSTLDKLKVLRDEKSDNTTESEDENKPIDDDRIERAILRINKRHGGDQMTEQNKEERELADKLLGKSRSDPEEVETDEMHELLGSDDPEVRKKMAEAVREIAKSGADSDEFAEKLIELLDDDDKDVKVYSAQALGFMKSVEALDELRGLTDDDDASVRAAAKQALRKIESESGRPKPGADGSGSRPGSGSDDSDESEGSGDEESEDASEDEGGDDSDDDSKTGKKKQTQGDGKMILNEAKEGIDDTETDLSELVLIWLLEKGDDKQEYAVEAFRSVVNDYPGAVKPQTGRFVKLLNDEHEDVRRYASIIVLEISDQYPEELEEHIPTILESLDDKDGTVHDNMKESLTNLAKEYPEKVVGGVADKAI